MDDLRRLKLHDLTSAKSLKTAEVVLWHTPSDKKSVREFVTELVEEELRILAKTNRVWLHGFSDPQLEGFPQARVSNFEFDRSYYIDVQITKVWVDQVFDGDDAVLALVGEFELPQKLVDVVVKFREDAKIQRKTYLQSELDALK